MLKLKTTPNMYGVTLMGDYQDLDSLYDSLSRFLSFFNDNTHYYQYSEYEYMLSLNYDIRHCYQGDRGFECMDNLADAFGDIASDSGWSEETRNKYGELYRKYKNGNLYYSVEILYPLIFHYLITFENVLDEEIEPEWFDKEDETGTVWGEHYSMIDAMRDRAAIANLAALIWENVQELLGREIAEGLYNYYSEVECPIPSSIYCDTLIHCQLVNFADMNREEKLDYLLASIYEIIDVDDLEEYPDEFAEDAKRYHAAIEALNGEGKTRFPDREGFYIEMDKIYDPEKPMYRIDFEVFLNDTYGGNPDPDEIMEFEW